MANRLTKNLGLISNLLAGQARVNGPFGVAGASTTIADGGSMAASVTDILVSRIISVNPTAARNIALPTAAAITAVVAAGASTFPQNGYAFEFTLVNTNATNAATLTTATGLTLLGNMTVALSTSGTFGVLVTSASAVTIYRK